MSTTWSLTSLDIVKGALELCEAIDLDQEPSAEDATVCLRVLNGVLKELPLHGIDWPKVSSTTTAVTWSGVTPSVVAFPADYFAVPVLRYTDPNSVLQPLRQIRKVEFERLSNTATAVYPQYFYVAPDGSVNLWPTPTQNPNLKLTYQAIVSDATLTVTPDIEQAFLNGLQYWLAEEIKIKFGVPPQKSAEIRTKFMEKRALMQQWAVEVAPIEMTVDDRTAYEFRGWPN